MDKKTRFKVTREVNKDLFAELLLAAKGLRSMKDFAITCGTHPSTFTRIMQGANKGASSLQLLEAIAANAAPESGVTFEALAEANGYSEFELVSKTRKPRETGLEKMVRQFVAEELLRLGIAPENTEIMDDIVPTNSKHSWSDVFGPFDYTPYDIAQRAELKTAEMQGIPIQMYARPEYTADELREMRVVFAKTAFVKAGPDAAYAEGLHPEPGFKNGNIYDNFPDKVCYVPEDWDFEEEGPGITAKDILFLCDGDKLKADLVFDRCEWEHPNTVLLNWDDEDERQLEALRALEGAFQKQEQSRPYADLLSRLRNLSSEAGTPEIQEAISAIEDLRNEAEHYMSVSQKYQEQYQKAKRLSVGLADMLEDVDTVAIERLVWEGHDLDMVCKAFNCDTADFDESGKYIRNKEGSSQSLNEKIQNAAGRAGEGTNGVPPKDMRR